MQNNGQYAVPGHSRPSLLVPIKMPLQVPTGEWH